MIRDSFIYKRHFAHIAFALECGTPLVVDGCLSQEKDISMQSMKRAILIKRTSIARAFVIIVH